MRASAVEFRLRMLINAIIICLGFWAPWTGTWGPTLEFAPRISLLEWLSLHISRLGLLAFADSAHVVIVCAALLSALGGFLRIWGSAYLGPATVQNLNMKAGTVMADGPFRYVRNPLYLGLWFMAAALAFLMPPSGALLAIFLITIFQLRLIFGEEAFLAGHLGESYLAYKNSVPRLIPRLRGAPPPANSKPQWLRSIISELTPIGVFVALAFFSWSYDNRLMIRIILISFGVSLVTRAFLPGTLTNRPSEG
jgi:protein-S-isoprenylcysteine O-methyltransferase Ste14